MRFEYLALADAANNSPDGKLNVLGFGIRIVTLERLPGGSPMTIVGSLTAGVDEAGEYDLDVRMVEPDGTEVGLVQGRANVPSEVQDDRVPTGVGFVVAFVGPFRVEGLHTIRARFGPIEDEYAFVVRLSGPDASDPSPEGNG